MFERLPASAAWRHRHAREGFEVAYFQPVGAGHRVEGFVTARENGEDCAVNYVIEVDGLWRTREATVSCRSSSHPGSRTRLEADGSGAWWVDGERAPDLDGCLDVDLEASTVTNTLVIRRATIAEGERTSAPAAYVRLEYAAVLRLEQDYLREVDDGLYHRFAYSAPLFDFRCRLTYDRSGLITDYPGIAERL